MYFTIIFPTCCDSVLSVITHCTRCSVWTHTSSCPDYLSISLLAPCSVYFWLLSLWVHYCFCFFCFFCQIKLLVVTSSIKRVIPTTRCVCLLPLCFTCSFHLHITSVFQICSRLNSILKQSWWSCSFTYLQYSDNNLYWSGFPLRSEYSYYSVSDLVWNQILTVVGLKKSIQ